MKNIVTIIVLVFAFTFTAQAQKKGGKGNVERMIKKMSKELNLTEAQQSKIKPLLVAQFAERKAMNEKRKAMKDAGQKPSKQERMKMKKDKMAAEIALNTKMASILDKEQFAKFEAIAKEKKAKGKMKEKGKRKKQ